MQNQSFFMVYVENSNAPDYRHATLQGAETEAQRLAKLHCKKTYVLCSVKSFEVVEFKITDCRPKIDEIPF